MLYINTRDKGDSYTAYRALFKDSAVNGGEFLPIRFPAYDAEQLSAICEQPFNEIVAKILNGFFTVRLTGWDVEFAIGRKPVKFSTLGRKVFIAELWDNTVGNYQQSEARLFNRLCESKIGYCEPSGWARIAIRIAFLFGIYGELKKQDIFSLDVAVTGNDMDQVMALLYARHMGLPVNMLICGAGDQSQIWELVYKSEINSMVPSSESISAGMERMIFAAFGSDEVQRYLYAVQNRLPYKVPVEMKGKIDFGMYISVVGENRVSELIANISGTIKYVMSETTAMCYGALQDYRSKTGENQITLILSDSAPR